MTIDDYLLEIKPLSLHARFALGLRVFERYVSLRGLQDESIWAYLSEMWEYPLIHDLEGKFRWEGVRCDLANYGLGDELPEELEEELISLAINEDYFELWVTNVTELAWGPLLDRAKDEESLMHLRNVLRLAAKSNVGVPETNVFSKNLFIQNDGWGEHLTQSDIERWQASRCHIILMDDDAVDCSEALAFFD